MVLRLVAPVTGLLAAGGMLGTGALLLIPASAGALTLKPKLLTKAGYGAVLPTFARTANGSLHVVYESNTSWGDSANGVAARTISPSGAVGAQVQALDWHHGPSSGIPGVAVMPGGALEAVLGGSPGGDPGPWGISSGNGGLSWTSPTDVGSGSMEGGGAMTLQVSHGQPVLTEGCCGALVVQYGFGPGALTKNIVNSSDGFAGNVDSAVDANGSMVVSWDSLAGSGGLWFQQVAPSLGGAVKVPVPSQYGTGNPLPVAGRDNGSGVFAAYPANYGATSHMRLLRYGGGSVAVGSLKGLHADGWSAVTGLDGRIWAIWAGTINGKGITALTRSNKAVTRFEPIQRYPFNWSGLTTFTGDGRLGPLDMLMSGTPAPKTCCGIPGIYYVRILPELSASVAVKKLGPRKFKLSVKVTDAGDAVSGAKVSAKGKSAVTGATGGASLKVKGKSGKHVKVTVSDAGYRVTVVRAKL